MAWPGVEFREEHARLFFALVGAVFATAGFLAGRWSEHRRRVSFKREDLVTSSVLIELYAVTPDSAGHPVLHIVSQGGSASLDGFFRNPDLVRHIQRAAKKHPGLLQLPDPIAHRMMMDEGKDTITGHDPGANMDFVHGRPTRDDATLFAFAAYPEIASNGTGLRDEVARLVLMVVSPALATRCADPAFVATVGVAHAGYHTRRSRLHEFALEWQRLLALPGAQRSAGSDRVWQITVRTALA